MIGTVAASGRRRSTKLNIGTLLTSPDTVAADKAAGLTDAMVEVRWDLYETSQGTFSSSYIAPYVSAVNNFRSNGFRVCLGIAIHATPAWVLSLTGSAFVNEAGNSPTGEFNAIFDQRMRTRMAALFTQLNSVFNFSTLSYIRIITGTGEMMLPDFGWCAYDTSAQNGPNMASGLSANPFPGWRPGETTISTAQSLTWYRWYVGCVAQYADWWRTTCDGLGFAGSYQLVCPGSGARPSAITTAQAARFSTTNAPVYQAAAWHLLAELLPRKDRFMLHCSSVAESSTSTTPGTTADQATALTSSTADAWGPGRWIPRVAYEYGLRWSGENPGFGIPSDPTYATTGSGGMMQRAYAMIRGGAQPGVVLYWAHDDQLRDGTIPGGLSTFTSLNT